MGENSKIEWTDHTFNAWIGCEVVSPACDHCYARRGSARLGAQHGLDLWGGDHFFTGEEYWKKPLRWNRAAEAAGVPARVFTNSYGDVFERRPQLVAPRTRLAGLVRATPWLRWLFLTKRPENADELWNEAWARSYPGNDPSDDAWAGNIHLGTTVEDVLRKDRIDVLRGVPALTRFLSIEPLLEDLGKLDLRGVHHVIVGGESGGSARPFAFEWAGKILEQCRRAGVPFFMKQGGDKPTFDGELVKLRTKKGGNPEEWPAGLDVREFPLVPGGSP